MNKIILEPIVEGNVIVGKDLTSKQQKQKEFYIKIKATKNTHTGFVTRSTIIAALNDRFLDGFELEVIPIETYSMNIYEYGSQQKVNIKTKE